MTAGLVVLGYAWWAVSLPPFSGLATVAVLLPGVGVVASMAGRCRGQPPPCAPTARAWGGLAAAAGAWEFLAYVQHPRADHPTLSSLTNAMLDSQPARAAAFVLWLRAMVELARR